MRSRACLLLVLAACAEPRTAAAPPDTPEQAAFRAWYARFGVMAADPAPEAAKTCAREGWEHLTHMAAWLTVVVDPKTLHAQALACAERATAALPQDGDAWWVRAKLEEHVGRRDAAAASWPRAAALLCAAPNTYPALKRCGDAQRSAGDAAAAVEAYKRAFARTAMQRERFEVLDAIAATSVAPSRDLASMPPEIVAAWRAHAAEEEARRTEEALEREREAAAQRDRERNEQAAAARETPVVVVAEPSVPQAQCKAEYGKQACGFGCIANYGTVRCAETPLGACKDAYGVVKCWDPPVAPAGAPPATCVAEYGAIACGYGCVAEYGKIRCSATPGGVCNAQYGDVVCVNPARPPR
jgi:hypothetical protein